MQQGHSETPVVGSSRIFNNKTRLLVIGIVLALALGYLVYAAFPGNTLYYLTVDEFLADEQNMDGRSIRVVGRLVPESLQRAPSSMERQFSITAKDVVLPAALRWAPARPFRKSPLGNSVGGPLR